MSLLPINATPQENSIETAASSRSDGNGIADLPVPIRDLWNAQTCPSNLLPWLAWAFSVPDWSPSWTDAQKRGVISTSVATHRVKGTVGAVQRFIDSLGIGATLVEWFNTPVSAGSFTAGYTYTIASAGTTSWTGIGAANGNVGTSFVATGSGSGTGTAYCPHTFSLNISLSQIPSAAQAQIISGIAKLKPARSMFTVNYATGYSLQVNVVPYGQVTAYQRFSASLN